MRWRLPTMTVTSTPPQISVNGCSIIRGHRFYRLFRRSPRFLLSLPIRFLIHFDSSLSG